MTGFTWKTSEKRPIIIERGGLRNIRIDPGNEKRMSLVRMTSGLGSGRVKG